MRPPTLRDRYKYAFDGLMARGAWALVTWHIINAMVAVLIVSIIVALVGLTPVDEEGQAISFGALFWTTLMHAIDQGTLTGDEGSYGWLGVMLVATALGILFIGSLFAVLVSSMAQRFEELRKGRSRVIEFDHTLLLGWSRQVFTLVEELALANASRGGGCVVILADHDKTWMEDELRSKVPNTGRTRVVVRAGDPTDPGALEIVSPEAARALVVLAPEGARDDTHVLRALLAAGRAPAPTSRPQHLVTELRNPRNVAVARLTGTRRMEVLEVGDLVAKIAVQTCLQSGLSVIYDELLGFDGDELYFWDATPLVGRSFGDALHQFEDCTVFGIRFGGGKVQVGPPMDHIIAPGEQLVVLAADDDQIFVRPWAGSVDQSAIEEAPPTPSAAKRIFILGWNSRVPSIIRGIDAYVSAGSTVTVLTLDDTAVASAAKLQLTNCSCEVRLADPSDRDVIEGLDPLSATTPWHHVMVLPEDRVEEAFVADAQVLVALLHLRDIAGGENPPFSIVSEMRDMRSRELAEAARSDDFIISDRLIGLILAQVAENPDLNAVFADLFDPEGYEIYLHPASEYVHPGVEIDAHTLVESGRRRGNIVLGYRKMAHAHDSKKNYGVVTNPKKSERFTLETTDRVIVLAE